MRIPPKLHLATLCLLVLIMVVPSAVQANKRPGSRTIYQQGKHLLQSGDYRAAIARFKQAYDLEPHRNILYAIGEAYRRLGELRQSHSYYNKYSELLPRSERTAFEPKLTRLRFGSPSQMMLRVSPTGAEVLVDGEQKYFEGSRFELTVAGGHHQLTIRKAGWSTTTQEVLAEFGEPLSLQVRLSKLAAQSEQSERGRRAGRDRQKRGHKALPARRLSRSRSAWSAQLLLGPSVTSYGDAPVDVTTAISLGFSAAYLWQATSTIALGAQLASTLTPFRDSDIDDSAVALNLYAGFSGQLRLRDGLWIDLNLWAGPALLLGLQNDSFLAGSGSSSTVVGLALRPALGMIWQPWRWLTLTAYPAAVEICPRVGGFSSLATNVTPLVRYQFLVGFGFQTR